MDIDGTNIPGSFPATAASGCCAHCSAAKGCDGFSYLPGQCYLKTNVTKFVPKATVLSARTKKNASDQPALLVMVEAAVEAATAAPKPVTVAKFVSPSMAMGAHPDNNTCYGIDPSKDGAIKHCAGWMAVRHWITQLKSNTLCNLEGRAKLLYFAEGSSCVV